jgi:maleylacetate reductase
MVHQGRAGESDPMSAFQPEFIARTARVRVRFGIGASHAVAEEVRALGCARALILSTPQQVAAAMRTAEDIGPLAAGIFSKAAMHTPTDITLEALSHVAEVRADCLVAVGGGSTTGLGKAIALRTDLPQVVIPTTYAGSEATAILGQTEKGVKTTVTDDRVQPEVIIYDPALVAGLPVAMTVTSGLNAIAHAVEALYARDRNPLASMLAMEGIQAFARALPQVVANPADLTARGETLYGAWVCGTVLGQVGMALHHKLCHTLGGTFNLPHAETHAVILPHAVAYTEPAVADLLAPVAQVFGGGSAGAGLHGFAARLGAPLALRDLGLKEADLDRATEIATRNPYWNPRPVDPVPLRALLARAWAGEPPAA